MLSLLLSITVQTNTPDYKTNYKPANNIIVDILLFNIIIVVLSDDFFMISKRINFIEISFHPKRNKDQLLSDNNE